MNEQDGRVVYGLLRRLTTSLKESKYFVGVDNDKAKHFLQDCEYTAESIHKLLDKIKFTQAQPDPTV